MGPLVMVVVGVLFAATVMLLTSLTRMASPTSEHCVIRRAADDNHATSPLSTYARSTSSRTDSIDSGSALHSRAV